jgi:AraC-like DNA-binding protein
MLRYNIYGSEPPIPLVTGPGTQAYTVNFEAGDSWLGVRLRPDNGCLVWQNSVAKAVDTVARGDDALVLLPELAGLGRDCMTVGVLGKAIEAAEIHVKMHHPDLRLLQCIDAVHTSGGRMKIETLSQMAGCSARHLNRLFRSNVGLNAKTYAQVVQFHRALRLVRDQGLPIAAAAFEGGYADHAHLTRAFQRFGGFTPSAVPADLFVPELRI